MEIRGQNALILAIWGDFADFTPTLRCHPEATREDREINNTFIERSVFALKGHYLNYSQKLSFYVV